MFYIELEENMDKFMNQYMNLPRSIIKMRFNSKCKNGKFEIKKVGGKDCVVLPGVNEKILKNLQKFLQIRCEKNLCVSENLRENEQFQKFADENDWKIMDGKWLFKHVLLECMQYVAMMKQESLQSMEISILCHQVDKIIFGELEKICLQFKKINILTSQEKQFGKLSEKIFLETGKRLVVSNNIKKMTQKSHMVVNFDFEKRELEKCNFAKNVYVFDLTGSKKEGNGRNVIFFEIDMPEKYKQYEEELSGFKRSILYESLIYKNTLYENIQKEIEEDDARVLYLEDSNQKKIKNPHLNLEKSLDKIVI